MVLEQYENILNSFIHDDNKMVTYKWLSKKLEIHVNVAKDILKQYWEKYKEEENFVATFLLIGQLTDRSIRIEIVKASNLNSAKKKFMKVDCEHLYSLQKCLQDLELLTFAGDGDLYYSGIKCYNENLRNDEEIESLRYVGNIKKLENNVTNKVQEKSELKPTEFVSIEKSLQLINRKNDSEERKLLEKKRKPAESKSLTNTEITEKPISPTNKLNNNSKINNKAIKEPAQTKQDGFNNLFSKTLNKPQTSTKFNEVLNNKEQKRESDNDLKTNEEVNKGKDQDEKKRKITLEENKNFQHNEKFKNISETNNKVDKKSNYKNKNNSQGTKRYRSQEKNPSSKRRRIIVDSSEDESNESNNEEEEELMEDEEKQIEVEKKSLSPPTEKVENGKPMIRKTIDKTFKDEDGYLVIKRIHVYEAVCENEESVEIKKQEPRKPKLMENKTKKQTTLINFFKKS